MKKDKYDSKVAELKNAAGRLLGAIESNLEHDSPDDFVDESTFSNERLRRVATHIDNVLGWFDNLQKGLNPDIEPQHDKFLRGKCQ